VNVENLKTTKPKSCNTKMPLVQLQNSLKKNCMNSPWQKCY